MKSYAEVLSEKLKKAGRDCVRIRKIDRIQELKNTIDELSKEAVMTGTFWTWMEAVMILRMSVSEQLLLCALWGYQAETRRELAKSDFWLFYHELKSWKYNVPVLCSLSQWFLLSRQLAILHPDLYQ